LSGTCRCQTNSRDLIEVSNEKGDCDRLNSYSLKKVALGVNSSDIAHRRVSVDFAEHYTLDFNEEFLDFALSPEIDISPSR
jgi:hypothetical protein